MTVVSARTLAYIFDLLLDLSNLVRFSSSLELDFCLSLLGQSGLSTLPSAEQLHSHVERCLRESRWWQEKSQYGGTEKGGRRGGRGRPYLFNVHCTYSNCRNKSNVVLDSLTKDVQVLLRLMKQKKSV